MTLREKVLSAIDNPGDWEIIGLLQDVAEELDKMAALLAALKHLVRWHDQLKPYDIAKAKAAIAKAEAQPVKITTEEIEL